MRQQRARRIAFAALGLFGLGLVWQAGYFAAGPFVLPEPVDTFRFLLTLIRDGTLWHPVTITTANVLVGYGLGAAVGLLLGFAGGAITDLGGALEPVSTLILGVPPIAWIVLSLLWFGPDGITPPLNVAIGTAPIVFAATLAGMRAAAPEFDELAAAFGARTRQRLIEIHVPQVSRALVPALAISLGLAWKMAVMVEVLSGGRGIGGRIADARSHLDMTETMAWILVALVLLLATDRLLAKIARIEQTHAG